MLSISHSNFQYHMMLVHSSYIAAFIDSESTHWRRLQTIGTSSHRLHVWWCDIDWCMIMWHRHWRRLQTIGTSSQTHSNAHELHDLMSVKLHTYSMYVTAATAAHTDTHVEATLYEIFWFCVYQYSECIMYYVWCESDLTRLNEQ